MSDESHFTPDHIDEAAYLYARGNSWGLIANEIKHPYADRLRRTMTKDPAFKAAVKAARDELMDASRAESVHQLRKQLRSTAPGEAAAAAAKLLDITERYAQRQHARELAELAAAEAFRREQFRAAERARLQKERIDAQYKVEELRARTRLGLGIGQPLSEKERLKKQIADRDFDERFHEMSRRTAAYMADEAHRTKEPLWLYGGQHPAFSGQAPDHTDTPFRVYKDFANGKPIYWLVDNPTPFVTRADYIPPEFPDDEQPPQPN